MTTPRTKGQRRRKGGTSFKKLAISMPAELARKIEQVVDDGGAASVSALISDTMAEKLERDGLEVLFDEVFGQKPMTAKERRWVARALRH